MKRRTVKRILTYVRPYRAAFAASCASALLYVLFTLLGPVFTGRAIDNILGPGQVDLRGVLYYLALLGISVLLAAASQWVMNVCTRKISSRASNDMRGEAFRVLNRTPLKYIDGHTHGDIISRMVNDADRSSSRKRAIALAHTPAIIKLSKGRLPESALISSKVP